jgi:hypothetical protein
MSVSAQVFGHRQSQNFHTLWRWMLAACIRPSWIGAATQGTATRPSMAGSVDVPLLEDRVLARRCGRSACKRVLPVLRRCAPSSSSSQSSSSVRSRYLRYEDELRCPDRHGTQWSGQSARFLQPSRGQRCPGALRRRPTEDRLLSHTGGRSAPHLRLPGRRSPRWWARSGMRLIEGAVMKAAWR